MKVARDICQSRKGTCRAQVEKHGLPVKDWQDYIGVLGSQTLKDLDVTLWII